MKISFLYHIITENRRHCKSDMNFFQSAAGRSAASTTAWQMPGMLSP